MIRKIECLCGLLLSILAHANGMASVTTPASPRGDLNGAASPKDEVPVTAPATAVTTTGVRFSLFPKVHRDGDTWNDPTLNPSVRKTVRKALADLDTLGVEVRADGVMTTCLLGPEAALFEAVRVVFGRASTSAGGLPRQVSLQCTFEALQQTDADSTPPRNHPPRTVLPEEGTELVAEAYRLPFRVACQFSVYPLGAQNHRAILTQINNHIQQQHTSVWKPGDTPFCTCLEGSGLEVWEALRSCFQKARVLNEGEDVVLTATLTGNKRQWTDDFFARTCND